MVKISFRNLEELINYFEKNIDKNYIEVNVNKLYLIIKKGE